jgi:hypothetical protein
MYRLFQIKESSDICAKKLMKIMKSLKQMISRFYLGDSPNARNADYLTKLHLQCSSTGITKKQHTPTDDLFNEE